MTFSKPKSKILLGGEEKLLNEIWFRKIDKWRGDEISNTTEHRLIPAMENVEILADKSVLFFLASANF